jgi:hypothetical protein
MIPWHFTLGHICLCVLFHPSLKNRYRMCDFCDGQVLAQLEVVLSAIHQNKKVAPSNPMDLSLMETLRGILGMVLHGRFGG